MTRCISDQALERVQAELGTVAERAHLASCAACTGRYRRLHRELMLVTDVLRNTPEPVRRAIPLLRRRWMPAMVGLSAAAVALLIWAEVAVWRAVAPPPTMQPQEVAAILADVSAALFSVSGDPVPAAGDEQTPTLEAMAGELDNALTGGTP
ncbi:MAG TPA: hypothetical protein VN323_05450 [Candidatus Dormibacteraeota bacterium]|jgi:hypothetical protein|nr:hypothetical protein [Candidatus Dormibacteraeota bacterium]